MLGFWESKINVRYEEAQEMSLDHILRNANAGDGSLALNEEFRTIRYISDKEYYDDIYKYVEPLFSLASDDNLSPRFIIFSAPGATGKTALAKYICHHKGGIYWDLPDNKVAEYSLQGALQNAVGIENLSTFYTRLKNGKDFLVIDGFDEAEAGSGRSGIEFFLRDLNSITDGCEHTCAVLTARTESAIFIKNYLINNNISFIHYEVGYFAEHAAKQYIVNGLEKMHVQYTNVVRSCIDAQFNTIRGKLMNEDVNSFLGYAPVLKALTVAYDEEKNTLHLLEKTLNSENSCHLLKTILYDLLERERGKFLKALKVKLPKVTAFSENVYDKQEQLLRIFGKLAYNDESLFVPDIDKSIPVEYHEEYLEVINTQLSQHPFIKAIEKDNMPYYEFAGVAFQDFVVAFSLAFTDSREFVREYLSGLNKYCPSQLLIEFYNIFSKGRMEGIDIPLFYNSFRAHSQVSDKVIIHINGDKDDCSIEFTLEKETSDTLSLVFTITDLEKGIYIDQLSNCYIDVDGDVHVGNSKNEARINNSVINCNNIIWRSERVSIEAYSPGECTLVADSMKCETNMLPMFDVRLDEKQNLKIFCSSLRGYFKLIPYHADPQSDGAENSFMPFANLVRRIFSCLRSHSKDAPARKIDFIDNRIISSSEGKRKILNFLLDSGVLYTDEQNWLYKLKTDKLSDYAIKWQEVRDGDFASLKNLYSAYAKNPL